MSLASYSLWGCKESDTNEWLRDFMSIGLFLGFIFCFIGLFWLLLLYSVVWNCKAWYLQLCSFSRFLLTICNLLCFHTNFRIICYTSVKNSIGILIRTPLNLETALGNIAIWTKSRFYSISYTFPLICIIFNFFHQSPIVFRIQVFDLLG